jgi:branched-chain amino acid transport system permease protein
VRWLHRIVAIGLTALAALFLGAALPAYAEGETIGGTLSVSQTGKAIEGVTVTITAKTDGTEVAAVETDADGRFSAPLPAAGVYTVAIDTDSLPDGITLEEGEPESRDLTVVSGQRAAVLFSFSDGSEVAAEIKDIVWAQRVAEGLRYGLIIAITAIGLSLIFGTTGLTNFSHGEMVTVGAFAAWWVNTSLGAPLALATAAAVIVGVLVGALNELAIWRPLRKRRTGLIAMLVVSIGLGLALRYILLLVVKGDRQFYDVPTQTVVDLGPISITPRDMQAMGLCLVVLVSVAVMLQFTKIGKAMRAVADNRDLAASSGINVNRVILVVWMLGGGLAAFGGVMYGWTLNLRYDMGFALLLLMFAGVVLGGLGTAYGALVGSLVIGVIVQLSTLVIPDDIKTVSGLLVLILILLVRPSGLLGARQRIG